MPSTWIFKPRLTVESALPVHPQAEVQLATLTRQSRICRKRKVAHLRYFQDILYWNILRPIFKYKPPRTPEVQLHSYIRPGLHRLLLTLVPSLSTRLMTSNLWTVELWELPVGSCRRTGRYHYLGWDSLDRHCTRTIRSH